MPRLAGVRVRARFSLTRTPSTYNRPIWVTASSDQTTCLSTPAGSRVPAHSTACSPLPVVSAPRSTPEPDCGDRKIYCVPEPETPSPPELLPKSKIRAQLPLLLSVSQTSKVALVRLVRIPLGKSTWPLLPSNTTAPPTMAAPPCKLPAAAPTESEASVVKL